MSTPIVTCPQCGQNRPHKALGECGPCYNRRFEPRRGNPGGAGVPSGSADIAGRIEDYLMLLDLKEQPLTIAQRLGVSRRTLYRYDVRIRAEAS